MPILDIQRRGQQIGRIRIGEQVSTGKKDSRGNDKMRPSRLSTFRFTTASAVSAKAIAALYGGTVRDWQGQFEVITSQSAIGVTVPPRDQVVSQWYEMWSKGGCQRRCDSVSRADQRTVRCLCPHAKDPGDEDEVARAPSSALTWPGRTRREACKIVTRVSVMIPDLPGIGVFRIDTGSFYAASEIGDTADILQMARDRGIFLPAMLRIEQRTRVANGETKKYPVPVLEITATFRQIASGALEAGGIAAQLPPPAGEQPKAITAGTSDLPGPASPTTSDRAGEPERCEDIGCTEHPGDDPWADPAAVEAWERARDIYQDALATTSAVQFRAIGEHAKAEGLEEEHVCTDRENDVWEPLGEALRAEWRSRAGAA